MLMPLARSETEHRASPDPFRTLNRSMSAEAAWLWTMAALIARREGARYTANKGCSSAPAILTTW